MLTILLIIQFFVVIALISVILLQPSEGGALGFGGNKDFMSVRGTKNALTTLTTILAVMFFVITILLIVVSNAAISGSSVLGKLPDAPKQNPGLNMKPITITIPPTAQQKTKEPAGNKITIPITTTTTTAANQNTTTAK